MGTQFWWAFDIIAAAILLVSVFLGGHKGLSKTIISLVGMILSFFVSLWLCKPAANMIYRRFIQDNRIDTICSTLDTESISGKFKNYIEGLGYDITVDENQLTEIFSGDDIDNSLYEYVSNIDGAASIDRQAFSEEISSGFGDIMESVLSVKLTGYLSDAAAEKISEDTEVFSSMISLIYTDSRTAAAKIEENYTRDATVGIIRLLCIISIVFIGTLIFGLIESLINSKHPIKNIGGEILNYILGAAAGFIKGAIVLLLTAAAVEVLVILGSGDMMFFNSDTIDSTMFFGYIYDIAAENLCS
jgi:uncharacterized membrane protein required for colicin V production